MNIRDSMRQNLVDLAEFMHDTASLDISQLGSEWESRKVAIEKHAVFLDTFTIPEIADPIANLTVAQFSPPSRNGSALYAGPLEGESNVPV